MPRGAAWLPEVDACPRRPRPWSRPLRLVALVLLLRLLRRFRLGLGLAGRAVRGRRGRPRDLLAGAGGAALREEGRVLPVGELRRRDALAAGRQEAALPAAAAVVAALVLAVARRLVDEEEPLDVRHGRIAREVLLDRLADVVGLLLLRYDLHVLVVVVLRVVRRVALPAELVDPEGQAGERGRLGRPVERVVDRLGHRVE